MEAEADRLAVREERPLHGGRPPRGRHPRRRPPVVGRTTMSTIWSLAPASVAIVMGWVVVVVEIALRNEVPLPLPFTPPPPLRRHPITPKLTTTTPGPGHCTTPLSTLRSIPRSTRLRIPWPPPPPLREVVAHPPVIVLLLPLISRIRTAVVIVRSTVAATAAAVVDLRVRRGLQSRASHWTRVHCR